MQGVLKQFFDVFSECFENVEVKQVGDIMFDGTIVLTGDKHGNKYSWTVGQQQLHKWWDEGYLEIKLYQAKEFLLNINHEELKKLNAPINKIDLFI